MQSKGGNRLGSGRTFRHCPVGWEIQVQVKVSCSITSIVLLPNWLLGSHLGLCQSPKQWNMWVSSHPNVKESFWTVNDAKTSFLPALFVFHPSASDYEAAIFLQTENDKEVCVWFNRNSGPPKPCGLQSNYFVGECVCSSKLYASLPQFCWTCTTLMMLSEALPVIFQAAGLGLAEQGLSDQTMGPSPLTDTHKEQKVNMCKSEQMKQAQATAWQLLLQICTAQEADRKSGSGSGSTGHSEQWS